MKIFDTRRSAAVLTIKDVHDAAVEARLLCNDIIRQTSIRPLDGKIGGAAYYAPEDTTEKQAQRLRAASRLLRRARKTLYDSALSGEVAEAAMREKLDTHEYAQIMAEEAEERKLTKAINVADYQNALTAIRLQVAAVRHNALDLCNDAPDAAISGRASYITDRLDAVLREIEDVAEYTQKHAESSTSKSENITLQK